MMHPSNRIPDNAYINNILKHKLINPTIFTRNCFFENQGFKFERSIQHFTNSPRQDFTVSSLFFFFFIRLHYCNIWFFRLWPCHSVVSRRQVVLHAIRSFRYTPHAGAVDRAGRPADDTHDQVPALPQQSPRTPVPTVHHPTVTLWHYSGHVDFSLSVATRCHIHVRGTRMELHGLVVLLFHITHHYRSRRLHPG